jgi:tRNA nucleotidyltransferase (CCA-adding enzyme)
VTDTAEKERSAEGWRLFPHSADIGVEGWGPTLEAAFEQAAFALTAAVTSVPIDSQLVVEVSCKAPERETLFVEWLNAIIYEMALRRMLFGRFRVTLSDNELHGRLWGEAVDPVRHEPACEPKGATYTELNVHHDDQGTWSARCIVDV